MAEFWFVILARLLRRRIRTKYNGICIHCKAIVPAGETVYWEKGSGIWHVNCKSSTRWATETAPVKSVTSSASPAPRSVVAPFWEHHSARRAERVLVVSALLLIAGAAGAEAAYQTIVVPTHDFRTYAITNAISYTSHTESLVVQPAATQTMALKTTDYSVSSGEGYPTCPYGGSYYARICTRLCGCEYDVCVSFDYNCANDYHAVYVVVYAVTYFRTSTLTSTSTAYTQFSTATTYCTTLHQQALATEAFNATRRVNELNPLVWGFATTGALLVITAAILHLRAKRIQRQNYALR
jgi:hypothetical protein